MSPFRRWWRRHWDTTVPFIIVLIISALCLWSLIVNGPGWPFE